MVLLIITRIITHWFRYGDLLVSVRYRFLLLLLSLPFIITDSLTDWLMFLCFNTVAVAASSDDALVFRWHSVSPPSREAVSDLAELENRTRVAVSTNNWRQPGSDDVHKRYFVEGDRNLSKRRTTDLSKKICQL